MAEIGTDISKAASLLSEGKLVAIPTDTVYGLAANALDSNAIKDIYSVKSRPMNMPILTMIDKVERVNLLSQELPSMAQPLVDKYWPGALTLILKANENLPEILLANGDTVGVRVPNHKMTLNLLSQIATPLAVTSANISGQPSPTTAQEVNQQTGDKIDYILDGGTCSIGIESTIVSFNENELKIIRQGAIHQKDLHQLLEIPT